MKKTIVRAYIYTYTLHMSALSRAPHNRMVDSSSALHVACFFIVWLCICLSMSYCSCQMIYTMKAVRQQCILYTPLQYLTTFIHNAECKNALVYCVLVWQNNRKKNIKEVVIYLWNPSSFIYWTNPIAVAPSSLLLLLKYIIMHFTCANGGHDGHSYLVPHIYARRYEYDFILCVIWKSRNKNRGNIAKL